MPWELPTKDLDLLALAKGYPYEHPGSSYLYRDGQVSPLASAGRANFDDRTPVIAHGSNRAPAQLKRKFDYLAGVDSEIPVTRGWLLDHDVVYSAHITRYGAIGANLQHAPGVRVELFVTWLDRPQLQRMHDTELGSKTYAYGRLTGVTLELEFGPVQALNAAGVYLSKRGCLTDDQHDGQPRTIGLAAVPAEGRPYRTMMQDEVLAYVQERYGGGEPLDSHILETIRNLDRRQELAEAMTEAAVPPAAPHFEEEIL